MHMHHAHARPPDRGEAVSIEGEQLLARQAAAEGEGMLLEELAVGDAHDAEVQQRATCTAHTTSTGGEGGGGGERCMVVARRIEDVLWA